jgi:hypothetical protein
MVYRWKLVGGPSTDEAQPSTRGRNTKTILHRVTPAGNSMTIHVPGIRSGANQRHQWTKIRGLLSFLHLVIHECQGSGQVLTRGTIEQSVEACCHYLFVRCSHIFHACVICQLLFTSCAISIHYLSNQSASIAICSISCPIHGEKFREETLKWIHLEVQKRLSLNDYPMYFGSFLSKPLLWSQ